MTTPVVLEWEPLLCKGSSVFELVLSLAVAIVQTVSFPLHCTVCILR